MKYLKPLAIGLILLAICSYYRRYITEDDAWFAEESFWLLKEGKIKSEFFRGLLGWENNYFLSHKLFIALGAGLQYLLPISPYAFKLSGLLFFVLLIRLLLLYQRQQTQSSDSQKISFWLLLMVIFSNTLLIKMSFENRPELMVATFGFASFLLIYKKENHLNAALSGMLAGLAVLSHLNGLIYAMAGFVLLLVVKKYTNLLIFSLMAVFTSSFYFYDIWQFNGFETWWFQFSNDPATQNAFGLAAKLKVMLSYPVLFFESPEQAVLSLLFLVLGWSCRKNLKTLDTSLVIYSLALLISFWLLTKRASGIYQVLFMPTIFVIIMELYVQMPKNKFPKALYFAAFIYLCVGIVGNTQIINKNLAADLPKQYADLSTKIPIKKAGLVPLTFFFNEYPHYERLLCQTNFELQMLQKKEQNLNENTFFRWVANNKVHFVLLDYFNSRAEYYPVKGTLVVNNYNLVYSNIQFSIYSLDQKETNDKQSTKYQPND